MTEDAKKKKKYTIGKNTKVGMADPVLDAKKFNVGCNTATSDESDSVSNAIAAAGAAGSSGGVDCGSGMCMGEEFNLSEKRETKRYYVRPQNIFCANKNDVLKALIDVANSGENCTVYSLKNLDDHDDVHHLTDHDIIYYYDENVLYDKNHVLVMDYDLFIKHEEERKRLNKSPVALTKTDYANNYEDRMTKETVVEGLTKEGFALALDKDEDLYVGNIIDDNKLWMSFDDDEPYSQTNIHIVKDNDNYVIYKVDVSASGEERVDDSSKDTFDKLDKAISALAKLNLSDCKYDLISDLNDNKDAFNQHFDVYNIKEHFDRISEDFDSDSAKKCCICGESISGKGEDAAPFMRGTCCEACYRHYVFNQKKQDFDIADDESEN